jgi:RNA-directed DNA polymerase
VHYETIVPTVVDRVAQAAVLAVLEPIFERDFAEHSYGFRPGRGCKAALRQVDALLKQGYCWVVDADLRSYFDTIPHAGLLERVGAKIADGAVLELLASFLRGRAMSRAEGWSPEQGTPQGAVITPLTQKVIWPVGLVRRWAAALWEPLRYRNAMAYGDRVVPNQDVFHN